MNGFGQDPNYMYSFRQRGYNPQQSTIDAMSGGQDAFRSLRESLAYGQAGMEGKQRMERVVSMGLPANTDINKIQRVGYDPEMRRPIYAAPRPQPWGTYGSVGMNEEERPVAPRTPAGGPQPAQGTANIAQGTAPTLGVAPSPYSGSAISGTAYTPSAGNIGMGAYRPPTTTPQATSIAGGIGPAPLAAPLPSLSFPTREEEILNPYGLRNF